MGGGTPRDQEVPQLTTNERTITMENTEATETIIARSKHFGLSATTYFPMGPAKDHFDRPAERKLAIKTGKSIRGGLHATANVELHRDGAISYAIGGDFHQLIVQNGDRCTEKAVCALHAQALAQAPKLLAVAIAFYAAKDQKAVRDVVAADIERGAAPAIATNQTVRELAGEA
jgi:hypothetical protein